MFNLSTMADLIGNPPRRSRTRTPTPTPTPTTTTPETDTETPPTKPITDHQHLHPLNQHFNYNNPYNNHSKIILSFTNGGLKRQHHPKTPTPPPVVVYKECLKNHAASLGGHALDGCGEFMPSPTSTAAAINNNNPTLLKCAACGCHRNFHRREPDIDEYYPLPQNLQLPAPPVPLLRGRERSPNSSASPPPISSAYYPSSAPHMLLALSAGNLSSGPPSDHHHHPQQEQHHYQNRTGNTTTTTTMTTTPASGNAKYSNGGGGSSSRKRFRTKFSEEQKDKMRNFSEKLGWKLQKRDDNLIAEFCDEIGVGRSVLKVWMHNNKNTLGKVNLSNSVSSSINLDTTNNNSNRNNYNGSTSPSNDHDYQHQVHHHHHQHSGSSSSD
ncbi:hypothetical protein MKX03_028954 [Papaver bracteatum]|nr:hypothetical protein MKX03_028954 [Papaver bracteatum]